MEVRDAEHTVNKGECFSLFSIFSSIRDRNWFHWSRVLGYYFWSFSFWVLSRSSFCICRVWLILWFSERILLMFRELFSFLFFCICSHRFPGGRSGGYMSGFTLKGPNSGFWPESLLEVLEWDSSGTDMMVVLRWDFLRFVTREVQRLLCH